MDEPPSRKTGRLERTIWHEKHKGTTRQIVYGLISLSPEQASPKKLLSLIRSNWAIENGFHYWRDVTLHKDATRLTLDHSGHNMAILNNLVLGLCLNNDFSNLPSARRLFTAKPDRALDLILSG